MTDLLPEVLDLCSTIERLDHELDDAKRLRKERINEMVIPMLPIKVGDVIFTDRSRSKYGWKVCKILVSFGGYRTVNEVRTPFVNIFYDAQNILKSGEVGNIIQELQGWDIKDKDWKEKFFITKINLL